MSSPVDASGGESPAPAASAGVAPDGEELAAKVAGAVVVVAPTTLEDGCVVVVVAVVEQLGDAADVVVVVEPELGVVVDVVEVVDVLVDVVVDVEVVVVVGQPGEVVEVVVVDDPVVAAGARVTEQQGGSGLVAIRSEATAPPDGYDQSTSTENEEGLPIQVGGKFNVYVFAFKLNRATTPSEGPHVTSRVVAF